MKRSITAVVLIAVIALSVILYFQLKPEEISKIVSRILENPDEYNNPLYLRSLTLDEKRELNSYIDGLLFDTCKDRKIAGNCTNYFVLSLMQMKINMETLPITMVPTEKANYLILLIGIYSDLRSKYDTLTEDDLTGFTIPLVTSFCRLQLINETERMFWLDNILNVDKTSSHTTGIQIFYAMNCFSTDTNNPVADITELSSVTGKTVQELNSKICNNLPSVTGDICLVFDALEAKRFCMLSLAEDKSLMENLLAKEYSTNHERLCEMKLSRLYNQTT